MPGQAGSKLTRMRERSRFVDVLWRTVDKAQLDGQRRLAAEITYYAFFSLFPLLMVFVTIIQAVFDERRSEEIVKSVLGQFPVVGATSWTTSPPRGPRASPPRSSASCSPCGRARTRSSPSSTPSWSCGRARGRTGSPRQEPAVGLHPMAILGGAILVTTIVGSLLAAIELLPGLVKPVSFVVSLALNAGVILVVFR